LSSGAAILEVLRQANGRRCSGEDLSRELGVSRAAVWKQIEGLRRRGYHVEGSAGGYELLGVPDRLYAEEVQQGLRTAWLGREIQYFDQIDSTNRVASELAIGGAPHGLAVIAEQQSSGRGRLGRSFFSPGYRNLYTSIVLRPELTVAQAPTLILSAAVAVADAIAVTLAPSGTAPAGTELARPSPVEGIEIKWPNDVLLGGLKTSGILMEMSAEGARVAHAVLGIGVNLNVERREFPPEFRQRATSLRAHRQPTGGGAIDRVAFTRCLYGILEDVLDVHASRGFAGLRSRFDGYFRMAGRTIEVTGMDDSRLAGTARGIADDGALEVERADGRIERVLAGDVTLAPRSRDALPGWARDGEAV
jgi:BirA family biotin operon repressor/biotin-[acetyl-CoA-carboxylase] ligase